LFYIGQVNVLDKNRYEQLKTQRVVSDLWSWCKTRQCTHVLTEALTGGYVHFPPLPDNIDQLKVCIKDWQVNNHSAW